MVLFFDLEKSNTGILNDEYNGIILQGIILPCYDFIKYTLSPIFPYTHPSKKYDI